MSYRLAHLALLALACAPEQPPETIGCASIADCALGDVCDRPSRQCIPEPLDRFTGAFTCTVTESGSNQDVGLELSEITGNVAGDRYSFPSGFCTLSGAGAMLLGFHALSSSGSLTLAIDPIPSVAGRVTLGPYVETGRNAAQLQDLEILSVLGYSQSGFVDFSPAPTLGAVVSGYLDVAMLPSVDEDALFGVACPRGMVDCGDKSADIGGVELCTAVLSTVPMCTRLCASSGDCVLGEGACVLGFCTKPCTSDAECPSSCVEGDPGEGYGCF